MSIASFRFFNDGKPKNAVIRLAAGTVTQSILRRRHCVSLGLCCSVVRAIAAANWALGPAENAHQRTRDAAVRGAGGFKSRARAAVP